MAIIVIAAPIIGFFGWKYVKDAKARGEDPFADSDAVVAGDADVEMSKPDGNQIIPLPEGQLVPGPAE